MMIQALAAMGLALSGSPVIAGTLIASDVIRAGDELTYANTETDGSHLNEEDDALIGREVRRTVYSGQEIKAANTRSPRVVTRNQTVNVRFVSGALEITISGRAMGDAGIGEHVEVINEQSREKIRGTVTQDGWILAQ